MIDRWFNPRSLRVDAYFEKMERKRRFYKFAITDFIKTLYIGDRFTTRECMAYVNSVSRYQVSALQLNNILHYYAIKLGIKKVGRKANGENKTTIWEVIGPMDHNPFGMRKVRGIKTVEGAVETEKPPIQKGNLGEVR